MCTPFHTIVEPILHICLTYNKINGRFTKTLYTLTNQLEQSTKLFDKVTVFDRFTLYIDNAHKEKTIKQISIDNTTK